MKIVLISALLGLAPVLAAPYAAGDRVEAFSAADQHKQDFTLEPAKTRFLLVSHDMETGKAANAALDALGAEFLPGRKAIYLSNIHGMPGIGRVFALPKMRKYRHRIILGDDADLIARFPAEAGKVTVLVLKNGKVAEVRYWDPATENVADVLK